MEPYAVAFSWTAEHGGTAVEAALTPHHHLTRAYALPADTGTGAFEVHHLSPGWVLFRSFHQFAPDTAGQWFTLGHFQINLGLPTLTLNLCRSSSAAWSDEAEGRRWQFGQGLACLARTRDGQFDLQVQGGSDSVYIGLFLVENELAQPLGDEGFGRLVDLLGLGPLPSASVRLLSQAVENALFDSLAKTLPGLAQSFFLQAKATETIATLLQFLTAEPPAESYTSIQVRELHSRLMQAGRRPPSLADLVEETGLTARELNDEFQKLYGRSLSAFLFERRLEDARAAVLETSVPLEELALRCGFSQVAQFSQAFKRQFGVTPESLR